MKERSPFRPSFGVSPPTVAGRDAVIAAVVDALEEGVGAPARISLVTGARGIGKTILLNAVEAEAAALGWLVVSETLSPGLLDRLTHEHVPQAWRQLRGTPPPDPADPRAVRRLGGLSLPGGLGGVSFEVAEEDLTGLRANLAALADALGGRGAGLLLTVDEIHRASGRVREDVQTLASTIQHLWREERSIAFVGAGLPAAVQDLLSDDVVTFLRRADRFTLGLLTPDEVVDALEGPVRAAGRSIDADALDHAVAVAAGYPYLVQIVGDLSWRVDPDAPSITAAHVEAITGRAVRTLGAQVHQPAVAALSDRDRDFLRAMLADDGPTAVRDLQSRLGVDHGYASRYRHRLIAAGLVRPAGRGKVAFALPYLREHLATTDD